VEAAKTASPKKGGSASPVKKIMSSPVDGTLNDNVVKEETIEEEMDEEQMTNMLKQLINEHLEKCNFCNIFTKTIRDCQESSEKRLIKVDHP
jgi:hypothetical protein